MHQQIKLTASVDLPDSFGSFEQTRKFKVDSDRTTDKLMNYVLFVYAVLGIVFGTYFETWTIAFGVTGLSLIAYYVSKHLLPDESTTHQYVLSAVLGVFMAQYIYQMHGLFEMHFFAFIGAAIVIVYRNWKLQIPLALIVITHHAVFGYLQQTGLKNVYFTQLDRFDLQTLIIHLILAAIIFFICGMWAHLLKVFAEVQISQTVEMVRLQKESSILQERRRSEAELLIAYERAEQARAEAEDANKAKSVFLATMSHEIRTPMNGVIGMASLLAETTLSREQSEYVETIRTCGDNLLGVINDILDFSKIESGKIELDEKDFDLRACVEEVLDIFGSKATTIGLDLIYQLEHDVPPQIIGDHLRLRQVLINLVGNAIKFTRRGEVFVRVKLVTSDGNHCELGFEVKDTGIGIPADKLNRLFKPFSQVDSSTTRQYGGTGLGLVISEKLVGLMGGSIAVSSHEAQGTTFSFGIKAKVSKGSIQHYVTCNMSGLEGRKVLVVDDNATNRNILKGQLESWKLIPVLSECGKEALEIMKLRSDFDLVLMDMQMPDMDGIEVTTLLKKRDPAVRVILLSSVADERRRDFAHLFASVLTKPVKQNVLCNQILGILRKTSQLNPAEIKSNQILHEDFAMQYPMRILIAEDNLINQMLTQRVLSKLGYESKIAANGHQVLEMMRLTSFNLILMDIQMPEMDGLQATRELRKLHDQLPVIVAMTANAMHGDREQCIESGMNDYLSKPIQLETVVDVLKKWHRQATSASN